jgi:hypothetical protein
MPPSVWEAKERDPESRGRWNFGIKATRAWRVTPETSMSVREFAPVTTASEAWQHIGAQGERLTSADALRILRFDLREADVFGETEIIASATANAKQILAPSKAGPVSQTPFVVKEAEGPKHLYILKLHGDMDAFLGESTRGKLVVKAGFSRSPQSRCGDFNRALPRCAFRWEVAWSGAALGLAPYPSSDHAKAGEKAMQEVLCKSPDGTSLGGEFFLAEPALIADAWEAGNLAARKYTK